MVIKMKMKMKITSANDTNSNHDRNSTANNIQTLSLSSNISPFRNSSFGIYRDSNVTNPDLLNTSMQHMEEIMNTHKLMKNEEFEQLINTKKELMNELDILQNKYNTLSREYANQGHKLGLLQQEHKHNSNQLETVLKKEIHYEKR